MARAWAQRRLRWHRTHCPLSTPTGKPETFFANIRVPNGVPDPATGRTPNMIDRNPDEETWEAVRAKWPVLASRSDDELNEAARPIRAVKVTLDEAKAKAEGADSGEGAKPKKMWFEP